MNQFTLTQCAALLAVCATTAPLSAGQPVVSGKEMAVEISPFHKGATELQIGATAFWSLDNRGDTRPEMNDVGGAVRLGWMLADVSGDGFFRGNCEFLVEGSVSGIVDGPGDILANVVLLLRYNFVAPSAKVVPYIQIGAGGTYSDAADDPVQRRIGSDFSFNLQAGLGARFFLNERTAIFAEANFRHISNADSADRNTGLNSLGGGLGVSWFF